MERRFSIDFDDFSPFNHRFDLLEQLLLKYPKMKVTMFMVPWDVRFHQQAYETTITNPKNEVWCQAVKQAIDDGWLELGLHGLTHIPGEFDKMTYQTAKNKIMAGQKMCEFRHLPLTKLFKAPQWLISDEARKAVTDLGLVVVDDGYYNWNLKDEMPDLEGDIIAHGHVQNGDGCDNGIEESFFRINQIPQDAKWQFLSEVLCK